jgi:hypothetical protein
LRAIISTGNHRVIDEQTQRDHQRPRGYAVEVDAEDGHPEEGRGQHQRNDQRHHHAGTQAEADEADHQHDRHRFEKCPHEHADGTRDDAGLVGNLGELDADRQFGLDAVHRRGEVVAQLEHVAGAGHGHGNPDGLLSPEAHRVDRGST